MSNQIALSSFFMSATLVDMCTHPNLTIPQSECLVLVGLYSGTNGPNWIKKTGWFTTANVENWFGIHTVTVS